MALWEAQASYVPSSLVVATRPDLDLRIARLEQEIQLEREITTRLRGEIDREHRVRQTRATKWEQERVSLRQRAESAEDSIGAEQRVISQLSDEWSSLKHCEYNFHKLDVDVVSSKLEFPSRESQLQRKSLQLAKRVKEAQSLRPLRLLLDAAQKTVAKQE